MKIGGKMTSGVKESSNEIPDLSEPQMVFLIHRFDLLQIEIAKLAARIEALETKRRVRAKKSP
jgi:hypothetical protein